MRESEIEEYLVKRVQEVGGEIRKVQWIGRSHAPDRRVMLKVMKWTNLVRLCVWVELKATGKGPTPAQAREHERMRALGETVYVINSFEQVDKLVGHGYV